MNWLTLFLPTLLLTHNTVDFSSSNGCVDYINCLNYVVTEYVAMLEENNPGLRLVNNAGHLTDTIQSLELQFESRDRYSLEDSRLMMLQLVDSFVAAINTAPHLQKILGDCPFTAYNVIIRVNFVSDCFYPYSEIKYIKNMSFIGGILTYDIENPSNPGQLVKLRQESLQQAIKVSQLPADE